jgi:hypothetical protein
MSTSKTLNTNEILLGNPNLQERITGTTVVPAMLCYERSGQVDPAPAGRWDGALALAKDELGQGYSGVYATDGAEGNAYAEGDEVRYAVVDTGDDFHAWLLAEGTDVAEGDLLEISATDGILQKYSAGVPVAVAMEAVAISGLTVNTPIACRRTIADATQELAASAITYDNSISGLTAEDVQDAIDELAPTALVYRALLKQSGTSTPTAVILENTLGFVPTLGRDSAGVYTVDLSPITPADDAVWTIADGGFTGGAPTWVICRSEYVVSGYIAKFRFGAIGTGTLKDLNSSTGVSLEIRVYP